MKPYTEAEIQVLIALAELADPFETPNNIHYRFHPKDLEEARSYFRGSLLDWGAAYPTLRERELLQGDYLSAAGLSEARRLRLERPPIYYWYCDFYRVVPNSQANADFSKRVYGRNLAQQGFMDMEQLDLLVKETGIGPSCRFLDLGCGNGLITEYISDQTGAVGSGMDYIPEAIEQAMSRTVSKRERLDFRVGNLDHLDYPPASFDVLLASDTLYMPNDLDGTLRQIRALLRPGGRMGIYYSQDLWENPGAAPEALRPENTLLGQALSRLELPFESWDFTQADARHAQLKRQVVEELRPAFEAEGNRFLYELRVGEAEGVAEAVRRGIHARYLYRVALAGDKPASGRAQSENHTIP